MDDATLWYALESIQRSQKSKDVRCYFCCGAMHYAGLWYGHKLFVEDSDRIHNYRLVCVKCNDAPRIKEGSLFLQEDLATKEHAAAYFRLHHASSYPYYGDPILYELLKRRKEEKQERKLYLAVPAALVLIVLLCAILL
jgi:hypothetical protein